jgi:hypothetical protein
MMKVTRSFYVGISCLMLLAARFDQSIAQISKPLQSLDEILKDADNLLNTTNYRATPPDTIRINRLLKQLNEIEKAIKAYKSKSGLSPEGWSAKCGEYLARLEMRRYDYVLAKQGKPSTTTEKDRELYQCKRSVEIYLNDPSPTAFVDKASDRQIKDQQEFLKKLTKCLEVFISDDSSFKQSASLLTRLFITKRLSIAIIDSLIKHDPSKAQELIVLAAANPQSRLAIETFVEYLRQEKDPKHIEEFLRILVNSQNQALVQKVFDVIFEDATKDPAMLSALETFLSQWPADKGAELLRKLVASQDHHAVQRVFEAILAESAQHPKKLLALEELLLKWPRDKEQEKYIEPLLLLLHRVRDVNFLAIIFREVARQIPDSIVQEYERTLLLIEDNLFGAKRYRYEQADRLRILAEHTAKLLDDTLSVKAPLAVLRWYRVGELGTGSNTIFTAEMDSQFFKVFGASFKIKDYEHPEVIPDSLKIRWHRASTGDNVSWKPLTAKPAFYVTRTFEYSPKAQSLELHLRFFDGKDDLLLAAFEETVGFRKDAIFGTNLFSAFQDVAQRLHNVLSAYLHFEDMTRSALPNLADREKLVAMLYSGGYFHWQFESSYLNERWSEVDGVYLEEFKYRSNAESVKLSGFRQGLKTQIDASRSKLKVIETPIEGKKYLTIYGEPRDGTQQAYDIVLGIDRARSMTITLNYNLTDWRIESSIQIITEAINSYLGINEKLMQDTLRKVVQLYKPKLDSLKGVRGSPPEPTSLGSPSWTNALPSLFLAGSSQFLIAKHKNASWKNWRYVLGSALLAGQVAALTGAAVSDNDAIKNVNNRADANAKLSERNAFLFTAAGMAAISFVAALIDIF